MCIRDSTDTMPLPPPPQTTILQVVKDVGFFVLLLVTMLVASSHISFVMIQQSAQGADGSVAGPYETWPRIMFDTFMANVVGDVEKDSILQSSEPTATSVMIVVLILVVLVIMLNLFIGETRTNRRLLL